MGWEQTGRRSWTCTDDGLSGGARIEEIEGGYRAVVRVKDTQFGMQLLDAEDFFESEKRAREFLKAEMDGFSS